jgi:hypothetical protein
MKKYFKFFFIILTICIVTNNSNKLSADNWMYWQRNFVNGDINKKLKLHGMVATWFGTDTNIWKLTDLALAILLNIKGKNYLGFCAEYGIYPGTPGTTADIIHEFQPSIFLKNSFKVLGLNFHTHTYAIFRNIEYNEDRGAIAFKLKLDLLKYKKLKFSVFDKIYYNYYNTQKIDRNRTGFEVGGFITKKLFVQLYYVLQKQKSISNSHHWQDTNVFGLDFSLKFK